jgi:hypothetical protein
MMDHGGREESAAAGERHFVLTILVVALRAEHPHPQRYVVAVPAFASHEVWFSVLGGDFNDGIVNELQGGCAVSHVNQALGSLAKN